MSGLAWLQPRYILALLIILYTLYFSWYTLNRHNTLHSYAADLSLIDQPLWNTVLGPGSFMEQTWGDRQQPRLAEHFEPLLIPLAFLFFIWDDVRILLIAQSLALALGAWPVFWIARRQLGSGWAGLAFATAYLLFPHLQAANIADFHADPFVVTPLLLAFWYGLQQRWRWLWLWAGVAMLVKENLPTLTAMLGLWLALERFRFWRFNSPPDAETASQAKRASLWHGLALMGVSTAWFLIATFLIVAPLARRYFGTDGPIYLAHRFAGETTLWEVAQDPARWEYLGGLLAAVAFLPLLAPELLLLGAPVLLANLLSNFPGQYSGEQHYSAPLVVAFILAAIYGSRRLMNNFSLREYNDRNFKNTLLVCICLWLLSWSLGYHALHGWTPLSTRTESYSFSPAARQLPSLIAQIPAQAVISASPGLHPHLAHRRVAYVFPLVQEADYLLVDVTDISGVHPNDVYSQLTGLLTTDWQLLQAGPGLVLAQKLPASTLRPASGCTPALPLPCVFYAFTTPTRPPAYPTDLTFGEGRLRLLGYDVLDDPDNGVTFRFHWQATSPLPEDLKLWPLVYDDLGQLLSDPTQRPMITSVWYPPSAWPAGQTIITETLPQLLPTPFHLGLAVGPIAGFSPPSYWPISPSAAEKRPVYPENWVQLASFTRQGSFLTHLPPVLSFTALTPVEAQFEDMRLTGFWFNADQARPGLNLPLLLQWKAGQTLPVDLTIFIHLLAKDGQRVAQTDAFPTWLTPQPTSRWRPHQPHLSRHILSLPAGLAPGIYQLQLGLYNAQTLERLPLSGGGDTLTLAWLEVKGEE